MSTDDPDPSDLPPAVRETLDSLGGALGDIAELDKEQLNETIGLLETLGHDQAAGILRSRREVLKGAGAVTGLGIAGLAGATATGGARAQSDTQTGTIGNGNQDADLQDVFAETVNTDQLLRDGVVIEQNSALSATVTAPSVPIPDVSSTTYTSLVDAGDSTGGISGRLPDGCTLYATMRARVDTLTSGESLDLQPLFAGVGDGVGVADPIPELELSIDSEKQNVTTGWTEITSITPTDYELLFLWNIRGRVSGGAATFRDNTTDVILGFEWRVD